MSGGALVCSWGVRCVPSGGKGSIEGGPRGKMCV